MIRRVLVLFLGITGTVQILSVENSQNDVQKIVKTAVEYAESQSSNAIEVMFQKKSVTVDSSLEGQIYKQYLHEQMGPYWKNVEQFCKDAANMSNLPQMNIWTKIQQLEEQIIHLQEQVDSLKKDSATNS